MSERVFIDTGAFFATSNAQDAHHAQATATARRLTAEQAETYTTNYVVAETHTLLVARVDRATALATLERIQGGPTRIIRATQADERRAQEILRQYADKDFSLIDAISFAVMERLHLRRAWTYDHHFSQFGFTQVP